MELQIREIRILVSQRRLMLIRNHYNF